MAKVAGTLRVPFARLIQAWRWLRPSTQVMRDRTASLVPPCGRFGLGIRRRRNLRRVRRITRRKRVDSSNQNHAKTGKSANWDGHAVN